MKKELTSSGQKYISKKTEKLKNQTPIHVLPLLWIPVNFNPLNNYIFKTYADHRWKIHEKILET